MRLQTVELPAAEVAHRMEHPSLLALLNREPALAEIAAPSACIVSRRYQTELRLLGGLPGLRPAAAALLAAHAAGSFAAVQPAARMQDQADSPLASSCRRLAGPLPASAVLDEAWQVLGGADAAASALDEASLDQVARLWPLAAASESLLAQGGDDRLALDPSIGLNRYGCAPYPRPDVIAFASCTASSISAPGLLAAEKVRRGLLAAALDGSVETALDAAAGATASRLLEHFGIADLADAMLVASGTDASLLMTALVAARHPQSPLTSVIMSPTETGSGVPEAVQGRHFSSVAASGATVRKASTLEGLPGAPALQTVALRDEQGLPLDAADVAAACASAVDRAAAGGQVVLHAIDGSKTGLTAPDRHTCRRLKARHGDRLTVVIDACQVRIEPSLVRLYLRDGFYVLITGSKFFAAPGFCGAVLAPRALARELADGLAWPPGLRDYATGAGGLVARRCPGLLLRWAAALQSMESFAALPPEAVRCAIDRLGSAVRSMVMRNPRLALVQAPRPGLDPGTPEIGWSDRSSVLSFTVRSATGALMSAAALRPLYLAMASDASDVVDPASGEARTLAALRCQIGQPVGLGGPGLGALRIAFSADQLAAGGIQGQQLKKIFAKLALLLGRTLTD